MKVPGLAMALAGLAAGLATPVAASRAGEVSVVVRGVSQATVQLGNGDAILAPEGRVVKLWLPIWGWSATTTLRVRAEGCRPVEHAVEVTRTRPVLSEQIDLAPEGTHVDVQVPGLAAWTATLEDASGHTRWSRDVQSDKGLLTDLPAVDGGVLTLSSAGHEPTRLHVQDGLLSARVPLRVQGRLSLSVQGASHAKILLTGLPDGPVSPVLEQGKPKEMTFPVTNSALRIHVQVQTPGKCLASLTGQPSAALHGDEIQPGASPVNVAVHVCDAPTLQVRTNIPGAAVVLEGGGFRQVLNEQAAGIYRMPDDGHLALGTTYHLTARKAGFEDGVGTKRMAPGPNRCELQLGVHPLAVSAPVRPALSGSVFRPSVTVFRPVHSSPAPPAQHHSLSLPGPVGPGH